MSSNKRTAKEMVNEIPDDQRDQILTSLVQSSNIKMEDGKLKVFGTSDIQKTIIRRMEVLIDGEPGLIYFKSVPGRLILSLSEGELSKFDGITKMATRLSETLVNEDGSQLMTVDQLIDTPLETLTYLMERIGEETGKGKADKLGEDSSGVQSSAQSTN